MNLHMNLLVESEVRSGSRVRGKFVIRVMLAGVFMVVLSIMLSLAFMLQQARRNLRAVQKEQAHLERIHDAVIELQDELAKYRRIYHEMEGWRKSRLDWQEFFTALQMITPSNAQLTRLMINERIEPVSGVPARKMMMTLNGKFVGESAREDIQRFDSDMRGNPVLASMISSVEVRLLGMNTADEPDVRVFDALCGFAPRKIGKQ